MKPLPILFVHTGNSNIIAYALNQAKHFNPDSEIILLGDESNCWVKNQGFTHACVSDYSEMSEKFSGVYFHMSPNPVGYERFCFQRWMVMKEYLNSREDIEAFIYLDTDVLLYTDVTEYRERYLQGIDITVCRDQGPQYTFLTRKSVSDLADYMFKSYAEEEKLEKIKNYYNEYFVEGGRYGGICDMTLFEWFAKSQKFFDTNTMVDNGLFDNSVNQSEGFENHNKRKKIVIKDSKAYGFKQGNSNPVTFYGLHFQGKAKWFMYRYYTGDPTRVRSKLKSFAAEKGYFLKVFLWSLVGKLKLKALFKKIFKITKPSV